MLDGKNQERRIVAHLTHRVIETHKEAERLRAALIGISLCWSGYKETADDAIQLAITIANEALKGGVSDGWLF